MTTTSSPKIWLIVLFVCAAAFIRVVFSYFPALSNFSPVAAMALFGGYYFRNRLAAFSLPMMIMFLSDVSLELAYRFGWRDYPGFHPAMPYVYAGFLAVVFIGGGLKTARPLTLIGCSLLSSVIFFVLSNFGVWMTGNYPATPEGLIACFVAAIPFFRFTVIGDLFFICLMFAAYEWLKTRYLKPAKADVAV